MIIEKCPICNEKMEAGRLFANYHLSWNPDIEKKSVLEVAYFEKLQKLPILKIPGHIGSRCKKCRIVIFQYPEI
jgi:hypothetical protein